MKRGIQAWDEPPVPSAEPTEAGRVRDVSAVVKALANAPRVPQRGSPR